MLALRFASNAADLLADQMLTHAVMVGSPGNKKVAVNHHMLCCERTNSVLAFFFTADVKN
jgi:hypothetical protein